MLRYFAFPDRVERISSNNDRRRILGAFGVASPAQTRNWTDQQLDDALFKLRDYGESSDHNDQYRTVESNFALACVMRISLRFSSQPTAICTADRDCPVSSAMAA